MEKSPFRVLSQDELPIVRLAPDEWETYREIRLAALADSPSAFGSTLARERAFEEGVWRDRLAKNGIFVAFAEKKTAVAIAVGFPETPTMAQLVSMWVHPDWRRIRLGDRLVATVVEWARSEGFEAINVHVTVDNEAAQLLYAGSGFARTGVTQPVRPEEPWLLELEMRREL